MFVMLIPIDVIHFQGYICQFWSKLVEVAFMTHDAYWKKGFIRIYAGLCQFSCQAYVGFIALLTVMYSKVLPKKVTVFPYSYRNSRQ